MTDGLDQALHAAVPSLLATADPSLTVFRGGVPNPTPSPPYVVVRSTIDRPSDDPDNSADGLSRVWVARYYCYCVGGGGGTPSDAEVAAIAVAQRLRTALLDVRPTVAGLTCGPLRLETTQPPQHPDEITGVPIAELIEIYRLRASN